MHVQIALGSQITISWHMLHTLLNKRLWSSSSLLRQASYATTKCKQMP